VRQGATVRELKRILALQLARVVDTAWGDRSASLSWSVPATPHTRVSRGTQPSSGQEVHLAAVHAHDRHGQAGAGRCPSAGPGRAGWRRAALCAAAQRAAAPVPPAPGPHPRLRIRPIQPHACTDHSCTYKHRERERKKERHVAPVSQRSALVRLGGVVVLLQRKPGLGQRLIEWVPQARQAARHGGERRHRQQLWHQLIVRIKLGRRCQATATYGQAHERARTRAEDRRTRGTGAGGHVRGGAGMYSTSRSRDAVNRATGLGLLTERSPACGTGGGGTAFLAVVVASPRFAAAVTLVTSPSARRVVVVGAAPPGPAVCGAHPPS
jgi:hypothetical protein